MRDVCNKFFYLALTIGEILFLDALKRYLDLYLLVFKSISAVNQISNLFAFNNAFMLSWYCGVMINFEHEYI